MYVSDQKALSYTTKAFLILLPMVATAFELWSWLLEFVLLLALFYVHRGSGFSKTIRLLAIGYLGSIFLALGGSFWQIGFTPWAGILLIYLKDQRKEGGTSVFWSLLLAALLSALSVLPFLGQALQLETLEQTITSAMALYKEQGNLALMESQGIPATEFERILRLAMPVYFKLLPGIAGLIGMTLLGLAYLLYRWTFRKETPLRPIAEWAIPWYGIWIAILGIASYLAGGYGKIEGLTYFGMNLMLLMAFISVVLGFSCLVYFLRHPKLPRFVVWIVILNALIFATFVLPALLFVGLFDLVLNFRNRIENTGEGPS